MANREIKVFLSSTFEDLKEVRDSIQTHLAVLTTDLLAMEVFGSDENRPKEYSLATVRESNLFIGVYAERYGTIDPETGSSLTELEYNEAVRMLERGQMIGLLTYILDENASWPIRYIERNTGSLEKLRALKEHIMAEHTVTFFREPGELPLKVLKDVIRKLEIGIPSRLEVKPREKEKAVRRLSQPIGMEFYDENERNFFQGRETEIARVVHEVTTNRITLLVGESGIGKTSLIRAGVCPELAQLGWRTAYVRPLNKPLENISRLVWEQILLGGYPKGLRPKSVIDIVSDRLSRSKCLIVIDQFEDVLGIQASKDTDELVRDLTEFSLEQNKNVHILIAYRGDLESRLGIFWQNISGSPTGLDRVYLGGLSSSGAKAALESNLKGCGLRFQEDDVLFNELVHDLIAESRNIVPGLVYPPLLQILAETVFKEARRGETFTTSDYIKTGRLPVIAGRYLLMRLQFLGEKRELARRILVALVRSYGLKSQKTLADLAVEIGETEENIRTVLNQLVQLRMVRPIDGHYEIVHDFLAKRISEELMEVYEREVKQFRELLASKLGAFTRTGELLTKREHLYLYFYRSNSHALSRKRNIYFLAI
jgi:Novel STAND NTPase 1/Domain of unknown function (DUF4062)